MVNVRHRGAERGRSARSVAGNRTERTSNDRSRLIHVLTNAPMPGLPQ